MKQLHSVLFVLSIDGLLFHTVFVPIKEISENKGWGFGIIQARGTVAGQKGWVDATLRKGEISRNIPVFL